MKKGFKMKLKMLLLAGSLAFVGCSDRTVGGPMGPAGPNPDYHGGTITYGDNEWAENAENKLVYHVNGPQSGDLNKVYVDFRFNGLKITSNSNYPSADAFCQIKLCEADNSEINTIRVNMKHGVSINDIYNFGRRIDYITLDFNGYFGNTDFVFESYAR